MRPIEIAVTNASSSLKKKRKKKKPLKAIYNHIPFGFQHGKRNPLLLSKKLNEELSKILNEEVSSLRCENS